MIRVAYDTAEYRELVQLRREVLRFPLGLDFSVDDLLPDAGRVHFGLWDEGVAVGSVSVSVEAEGDLRMRQLAVHPGFQHKGIGSALVLACEEFGRGQDLKRVVLHAREAAVPFYIRLSYSSVGDRFFEVGIPHFAMEKRINTE